MVTADIDDCLRYSKINKCWWLEYNNFCRVFRFTDKVTIVVSKGVNITISLSAEGEGTTIVSQPPLQPKGLNTTTLGQFLPISQRLSHIHHSGIGTTLLQCMAMSEKVYTSEQRPTSASLVMDNTRLFSCQTKEDGDKESRTRCKGCRPQGPHIHLCTCVVCACQWIHAHQYVIAFFNRNLNLHLS